ncbi:MAG: hypothetical protein AB1714_29795 [Acidobacteriota bacterium]
MPRLLQWARPIRLGRMTHILNIRGVEVHAHWTMFLVGAVMMLGAVERPLLTLVVLISYLGVLLIHETGHLVAARRRGSKVLSVRIYPIYGLTRFETPWSRMDHCVIAWGGVVAQLLVAIPLVLWVAIFGYTRSEPVNAILAILGFYSLGVVIFNLLPVPPLDGATAWGIIPALIARVRMRPRKRIASSR